MTPLQTVTTIKECQSALTRLREGGKSVGLVPTMGALHEGHLSLIKASKKACDITVVTIFVNPTQFAPHEDFDRYPRPLAKDQALLKNAGVDILFTPSVSEIYPSTQKHHTQVYIPHLSKKLCGKTRPHFFKGVLMVVNRLFNITQPTHAFFGEKDFQQLTLIKQMATDLFMPIRIIGCPIIREKNGLAMSSRNQYLSEEDKTIASQIYASLTHAKTLATTTHTKKALIQEVKAHLTHKKIEIEYIDVMQDRLLIAVRLGGVRLIDNVGMGVTRCP
jgi:pantoate--beta-alanine ligase